MTPEEKVVVQHFHDSHTYLYLMRMLPVVPLPQLPNHVPLGESRSRAVQRFNTVEHSLHSKGEWSPFPDAIKEYIDLEHTEIVPEIDLSNTIQPTTYLCTVSTSQPALSPNFTPLQRHRQMYLSHGGTNHVPSACQHTLVIHTQIDHHDR